MKNRRVFSHIALSGAAVGALLTLSACTATAGPPVTPASDAELVTQTPAASGNVDRVTWAVRSEPTSMDWIYNADSSTGQIMANVCEGLFRLDANMAPEPALAVDVSIPSPTTRVYALREDATFHDGSPLTAEDVVFSLKRHLDPDAGSFWSGPFAKVADITATGPHEVTISLSEPDGLLDSYLSSPAGIIERRQTVEDLGDAYGTPKGGVNCIGPYALDTWEAGQSITLTRDDNYFDERYLAKAETFEFQFVRDPAAITNGLLSGSIDGTWEVPPAGIKRLQSSGDGTVFQGPSTQGYNAIVMNTDGPLGNPAVRQALSRAIDRTAIISAAVAGAGDELRAPAAPGTWSYETEKFKTAWDGLDLGITDFEAAKELLAKTSLPTEPIVIASTAAEAMTPTIAAELQSAAKALGLEAEIRSIPADQYYSVYTDPGAREGIDLYLTTWGTDFADPTQMYEYFTTGNIYNFTGYSNPELDSLLSEAAATDDLVLRADAIIAAQDIVVSESLWLPIYAARNTVYLGANLTGTPASYVQLHHPWAATIGAAS